MRFFKIKIEIITPKLPPPPPPPPAHAKYEPNRARHKTFQFLKGNSGFSTSWAQMEEHEKSKRTSHH